MRSHDVQLASAGTSSDEILAGAIAASLPAPGLDWLDIGCGRGDLLRVLRDEWAPSRLRGIDPIDWLDDDLRGDVEFATTPAEDLAGLAPSDRVLMVEVIEHLESPWTALRSAARLVAPAGRIVVTTPNIATLRNRIELGLRGRLTSFRPDNEPHISPALPHVIARVLGEEGLTVAAPAYAAADVISLSNGRTWPAAIRARYPQLTSVSLIIAADRDEGGAPDEVSTSARAWAPPASDTPAGG
jgi:SAM-dependent methyltransferase